MNAISTNFTRFTAPNLETLGPVHYKQFMEFFGKFTEFERDFKTSMSRVATELERLKERYKTSKSEKLGQIIQQKEQVLAGFNEVLNKAREAYFSRGQAISDRVQAYLNMRA